MIDETRRGILKLFGVGAAAATSGVAVAKTAGPGPGVAQAAAHMPPTMFHPPEGMTYQWKRIFVTAEEPDLENIMAMIAAGWKPVPRRRHIDDFSDSAYWIERGGVVLMEKASAEIEPPKAYPLPYGFTEVKGWGNG